MNGILTKFIKTTKLTFFETITLNDYKTNNIDKKTNFPKKFVYCFLYCIFLKWRWITITNFTYEAKVISLVVDDIKLKKI